MGDAAKGQQSGQTSQNMTGTSTGEVSPWAAAQPLLTDLLSRVGSYTGSANPTDTETQSLSALQDQIRGSIPQANNLSNELAAGGVDRRGNTINNYETLNAQLTPTISGHYLDPNTNPWFGQVTDNIGRDTEERLRGMYAGSGRSAPGAGNYGYNAGKGIAEATAPIFASQYNLERGRQEAAFRDLHGAGQDMVSSLGGQDQQILQNKERASSVAQDPYNSLLASEAYKRNIPLSTLASLVGLATPMAGLGRSTSSTTTGTTTGTSESESNPSVIDSLSKISAMFK